MSEPQIIQSSVFSDTRGFFSEVLKDFQFRQINMSLSHPNVFRGIHAQRGMDKAMWVANGEATIFAVNLDAKSLLFGKTVSLRMKAGDGNVFYAPWWWGRGFLTHSEATIVYATTDIYRPEHEIAINYKDIKDVETVVDPHYAIISNKDLAAIRLTDPDTTRFLMDWKRAGDEIFSEQE